MKIYERVRLVQINLRFPLIESLCESITFGNNEVF